MLRLSILSGAQLRRLLVVVMVAATTVSGLGISASVASATPGAVAPATAANLRPAVSDPGAGAELVRYAPMGDITKAMVSENRGLRHSELMPTGRFVQSGDVLSVTVGAGYHESLYLGVGLKGIFNDFNGGVDVGVKELKLQTGAQSIVAPVSGMVYVINRSGSVASVVSVEGGNPAPLFEQGKTTQQQWQDMLVDRAGSPFVEIVSDRTFLTVQRTLAMQDMKQEPAAFADYLNKVMTFTDATYGLKMDSTGVAHKYGQRIHLSTPDKGPGGAYAANTYLGFNVDTNAAKNLLKGATDQQWALWHEVGHTYQTQDYTWKGLGEVVVNISSFVVQEKLGYTNRMLVDQAQKIPAHFARVQGGATYDAETDLFVKAAMFEQLRWAYGDNFYPRLSQLYRVQRLQGQAIAPDDEIKRQRFMVNASQTAGRDLSAFFLRWGLQPSAETRAKIATLPTLTVPIWDNLLRGEEHVADVQVGAYTVPQGELTVPAVSVLLSSNGAFAGKGYSVSNLDAGSREVGAYTLAPTVGKGVGSLAVLIQNGDGVVNALASEIDVHAGTTLKLLGISDHTLGTITLNPETKKLQVGGTTAQWAHDYFGDKDYFTVSLLGRDGKERKQVSVEGNASPKALDTVFAAQEYVNGEFVVVYHAEATNRLLRYDQDLLVAGSSELTQRFVILDDRLVPVEAIVPLDPTIVPDGSVRASTVFGQGSISGELPEGYLVEVLDAQGNKLSPNVALTVDSSGKFSVQMPVGKYQLVATTTGKRPSAPVPLEVLTAPASPVVLKNDDLHVSVKLAVGSSVAVYDNSTPMKKLVAGKDYVVAVKSSDTVVVTFPRAGTYNLVAVAANASSSKPVPVAAQFGGKVECPAIRHTSPFGDVQANAKFSREIDWMHCMGLSTGTKQPAGKSFYAPKQSLSREAMAAFMYRLEAPKNYTAPASSPFADVKPGDKFYTEISWMYQARLSTGTQQATGRPLYAPKQNLSREAMAAFMYRLEAPKNYSPPRVSPFSDVKSHDKFSKEMMWMSTSGLSRGTKQLIGKPVYAPKEALSREAMAAFVYRLVNDYRG